MRKILFKLLFIQILFFFVIVIQIIDPTVVFAACGAGQIDMLEYMGPENATSFELRYCGPNGEGSEQILVERGIVYTEEGEKNGFFINKGGNYEAYFFDDSFIYFYEDISWDEQCNGQEAFYRVFTPGEGVGGKIPRCISPGESFSSNQQIKAYYEADYLQYTKTNAPPTGNICSDSFPANVVTATVVYANETQGGPVIPGTNTTDTIAMTNVSGAGVGEIKYYTKGYGLTGFQASNSSGIYFESLFYKDGLSTSEPVLSCSSQDGTYDMSIYPDYEVDETKFYLSPIRNVINQGSLQRTVEKLRKELAMQGYQAYCATEGVKIEPEYNTKEKIETYLEQYNIPKILEMDAIEILNMTNAQYPLWRDVSNKQFLLASLEEYFGFRDVYIGSPSDAVLTSSPINSLLSEPQLCVQGWRNLVAQQLACERLKNPGECELLTRKIPKLAFSSDLSESSGPEYTVSTLLDELAEYEPNYRDGTAVSGCKKLTTQDRAANEDLLQGLMNTPTYFDRAYRYGFIVAVIHAKSPGTESGNVATKIFNFFTKTTRNLVPDDEVLVAAFKLPDIATNKGGGDDTGSQFWSDPLDLTRKLLFTNEQNITHEDVDRPNKRQNTLDQAIAAAVQGPESKIYCYEGAFPYGIGTKSCQNELTKALTDIINGNVEGCGEAEVVQVIKDLAGLDNPAEKYGKVFNNDNGQQVMLNLFLNDLTHPPLGVNGQTNPQIAKTDDPAEKLKSLFTISEDTWPPIVDSTTVDFYIVYPIGFELNAVETAMKSAFFSKAQLAALEADNNIDNFEMTDHEIGLAAGSVGFDYIDKEKTANGECGTEITASGAVVNKPCVENVSISVNQEHTEIGVMGAKLGYWMRKIQLQLNARASDAWAYFDSCKTTEEFLLGKCEGGGIVADGGGGGGGNGGPNPGNGPGLSCEDLRALTVNLPTMSELENMVCQIANGDSNDAQLVWGMLQVDGSPFLRTIRSGASSMSCGDILINSCGASQIVGVLIPQCIDKDACPQAAYIADNTSDPWVQEARNNPDVACDIETQLDFILRKRKSEKSYLIGQYEAAHGVSPSTQQLYYMMAARNYGLSSDIFTKPACQGAPAVQGCGGANYCECVMDTFQFSCN